MVLKQSDVVSPKVAEVLHDKVMQTAEHQHLGEPYRHSLFDSHPRLQETLCSSQHPLQDAIYTVQHRITSGPISVSQNQTSDVKRPHPFNSYANHDHSPAHSQLRGKVVCDKYAETSASYSNQNRQCVKEPSDSRPLFSPKREVPSSSSKELATRFDSPEGSLVQQHHPGKIGCRRQLPSQAGGPGNQAGSSPLPSHDPSRAVWSRDIDFGKRQSSAISFIGRTVSGFAHSEVSSLEPRTPRCSEPGAHFGRSSMVTSTPSQTEEDRQTLQRYSVESCPPSPDLKDCLDKSGPEDDIDDDDDDDEFSDGGHYKSPDSYHSYTRDTTYDNGCGFSLDGGNAVQMSAAPSSHLESMEMMKRRFYEHCLKNGDAAAGSYRMEYPLWGFPPLPHRGNFQASSGGSREVFQARHQRVEIPPTTRYSLDLDAFTSQNLLTESFHHATRHNFGASRLFSEEADTTQDPNKPGIVQDSDSLLAQQREGATTPKKEHNLSFSPERNSASFDFSSNRGHSSISPNGRMSLIKRDNFQLVDQASSSRDSSTRSLAKKSRSQDSSQFLYGGDMSSTKKDPSHNGENGSSSADKDTSLSVVKIERSQSSESSSPVFSSDASTSPSSIKKGHRLATTSPLKEEDLVADMPPTSSASSVSSPLTKIPIPVPMPMPGNLSGLNHCGYQVQMTPSHGMMLNSERGNPGSCLPVMPRLGPQEHLYFCHLCSYSGSSKDDFDKHMQIHFEYNCPHCDYTSRTEGRLKRHIKDFHSDPDNKQRAMPGRPKVFRCKQCEFSCIDKVAFWAHARTHIKEEKLLACPRCPFVTEYKHHLEYHLRNHFGSKPYKCGKCNYSCVNKSMLNSHMKSHTNVYQYRCSECTYATKYCHSLKLHLRKYNHKPATVLNSDGSLPQGIDAKISGLSLIAKRGPPRGPRGMKKEKEGSGEGFMPPSFFPMPHSPRALPPNLNPLLSGGMLPAPYWPILPNGIHPPPPLISMGSLGNSRHSSLRPGLDRMADQDGPATPCVEEESRTARTWDRKELFCRMCAYSTDSAEAFQVHVFKVHASENDEMRHMHHPLMVSSDPSRDEQVSKMQSRRMSAPPASAVQTSPTEPEPEPYPRRNTIPATEGSPRKVRMQNGENLKASSPWSRKRELFCEPMHGVGSNVFMGQGGGDTETQQLGDRQVPLGEGTTNILQQMTMKFGSVSSATYQPSVSAGAMVMTSRTTAEVGPAVEQYALDLTNKPVMTPLQNNSMSYPSFQTPRLHPTQEAPHRQQNFSLRPQELSHHTQDLPRLAQEVFQPPEDLSYPMRKFSRSPQSLSSHINASQSLSTRINASQSLSSHINASQSLSSHINRSQSLSSHIIPSQSLSSRKTRSSSYSQEDFSQSLQDFSQPSRDFSNPPQDLSQPQQDFGQSPQDFSKSHQEDYSHPPQTFSQPPQNASQAVQSLSEPTQDFPKPTEEFSPHAQDSIATANHKRQGSEISISSAEENFNSGDDVSAQPRKRARKGKAYKLDTLYLKRQEQQQQQQQKQQQEMAVASPENSDSPQTCDPLTDDVSAPWPGAAEEGQEESSSRQTEEEKKREELDSTGQDEADHFRQLQKDIQLLNSDILPEDATDSNSQSLKSTEHADSFSVTIREEVSSSPPLIVENSSPKEDGDPVKERESLIQAIFESRRQMVPPAVRRGTEIAWKILADTTSGVDLPGGKPLGADEESPASLPPFTASSPLSPRNGLIQSRSLTINSSRGNMSLTGGAAVTLNKIALTSPPAFSAPSAITNDCEKIGVSNCLTSPSSVAGHFMPNYASAQGPPRTKMSPVSSMPERLSTYAQTAPTYLSQEMFSRRLPPATLSMSLHQYECPHCDMGFKDPMMHSMHMTYHKESGNPFQCRGCGHVSKDKFEFFLHIARNPHS